MSTTCVPYPIVGAVKGTEQILGPNLTWSGDNANQKKFLKEYLAVCGPEIATLKDIETISSWDAAQINEFLAKKGFSIKLNPFSKGEFGVASVLDVLVKWLHPGKKRQIQSDGVMYPGAWLSRGVDYLMSPSHTEAIARIKTMSGDSVCLTMLDRAPVGFKLEALASSLSKTTSRGAVAFDSLHFPMVDLNQFVDIDWLIGLKTMALGDEWKISQAKQQTKLRMNELGARGQSAVAIGVTATNVRPPPVPLVINRPFLVWFERPGLARPLLTAHVTPDDWKEPADLETP